MAECVLCGGHILSSSIGCLNCSNLNLSINDRFEELEEMLQSDCSKCDKKCSKKVKNNTHFVDYPYTLETTKVFLNEKWQNVSVIREEQFLNGTKSRDLC